MTVTWLWWVAAALATEYAWAIGVGVLLPERRDRSEQMSTPPARGGSAP